jgi:hypothetical protein
MHEDDCDHNKIAINFSPVSWPGIKPGACFDILLTPTTSNSYNYELLITAFKV